MDSSLITTTINRFIDWSGRTVSWLTLFMVLITFFVVILRYVFDTGAIALQDSINYLHAMVFLIGASWTMQQEAHVRVDIFYTKFSTRSRAWVNFLGSVLLLFPVMCFITWVSWNYISTSWSVLEGSREAGGLEGVFLLKSLIIVFTALLLLQGIVQIITSFQIIFGSTNKSADKP